MPARAVALDRKTLSDLYAVREALEGIASRNAERTRPALQQHRQIVEALAQRDGELAEMLMRRHIKGAWQSIREIMAKEEAA